MPNALPVSKEILKRNLSAWCMMACLFFNPFGFDIVQYQLMIWTGSLWLANFSLYGLAGLFFMLSIFFRYYFKSNDQAKKHIK